MIKVNLHRVMADRDIRKQKELVKLTGITPNTISDIYTGKIKTVRFSTLNKLCRALDCTPGDLLEYIADPESDTASSNPGPSSDPGGEDISDPDSGPDFESLPGSRDPQAQAQASEAPEPQTYRPSHTPIWH